MKLISFYLPQFHRIPENDEWWGEGFTEWVNVRKAEPLFEGHNQPRVPQGENYYNLLDVETLRWQAAIARQNHVWGFCFYHYWFGEKLLLGRPMEMLLENPDIDMPFCISWANENWTNQWVSNSPRILIRQEYGDAEEWRRHFDYLLPFFRDRRYIREGNRPVVVIYKPTNFERINEMIDCWNELARAAGFDGLCFLSQISFQAQEESRFFEKIDYILDYEPTNTFIELTRERNAVIKFVKHAIKRAAAKVNIDLEGKKLTTDVTHFAYRDIWEQLLARSPSADPALAARQVPGCFVDWDNTPRKGRKGTVLDGACPDVFRECLEKQVRHCKQDYRKDFMFLFAWNEWAEGGYLEPDETFGDGYLRAIRDTLESLDEVPDKTTASLDAAAG